MYGAISMDLDRFTVSRSTTKLLRAFVYPKFKLNEIAAAFSWETDLWVYARWFYDKKRKLGKENLYLTENQLSGNEMWYVADITIICVTYACAKGFLDSNFH